MIRLKAGVAVVASLSLLAFTPSGAAGATTPAAPVAHRATAATTGEPPLPGWAVQRLGPTGAIHAVAFPDASHGFALNERDRIWLTRDGGVHWQSRVVRSGGTQELLALAFTDPSTGWAAGRRGTIFATSDRGDHWIDQSTTDNYDFTAASFPERSHGWLVGTVCPVGCTTIVKHTSDGGAHWSNQAPPEPLLTNAELFGVAFADTSHGVISGTRGIGWTADGGQTWTMSGSTSAALALTMTDAQTGWAVGNGGTILRTSDGGATWTAQISGTTANLRAVRFISSMQGWAVGDQATIRATVDGGLHWSGQTSTPPLPDSTAIRGVAFADATHGFVGGDVGTVLATSDGGTTWTTRLFGDRLQGVRFANAQTGWAVGGLPGIARGIIVTTSDAGWTWTVETYTPMNLAAVSFPDASDGWAVGDSGAVLTTSDGGAHWTSQLSNTTKPLNGVSFVDRLNGWAVGGSNNPSPSNVIVGTHDGGLTWAPEPTQYPEVSGPLYAVSFSDVFHGWAVGDAPGVHAAPEPAIFHTGDGGVSWQAQTSDATHPLYGVAAVDTQIGYAAGGNGSIFETIDGGVIWHDRPSGGPDDLHAAAFLGPWHGWAAGGGTVVETTPNSNVRKQLVPPSALLGISFTDATHGWAVGYAGEILVYRPYAEVLPAIANRAYGGYVTAVEAHNTGTLRASMNLVLLDTDGNLLSPGDAVTGVPLHGNWSARQDDSNGLPSGAPGSALLLSDQPLAAFVNEFAPSSGQDGSSYTGFVLVPALTLDFPAVAVDAYGGYTTGIGFVNPGGQPTDITITYRNRDGTVAKTLSLPGMPAHAYRGFYAPDSGLPPGFAGTATITSSSEWIAAISNEVGPGGQFSSYDAITAGAMQLDAPVALNAAYGGYYTGMGIQNTSGTAGTVTVSYYDGNGQPAGQKPYPISGYGYADVYQGSPAQGPPRSDSGYTATLSSDVAIAAIVNEVAPGGSQSTSYNPVPAGAGTVNLPLVEHAGSDGWTTGFGVMNTGTLPTTVAATFYDAQTGAPLGGDMKSNLAPSGFWSAYQGNDLPSGTRATVVLNADRGGQIAVVCNEQAPNSFMSYDGQ